MAAPLDLSLPEPPRRSPRPRLTDWLTLLGIIAIIILLVRRGAETRAPASGEGGGASPRDRLESLATDLERRTLYDQAAAVWMERLVLGGGTPEEDAETRYRIGKCLKEAGRNAESARWMTEVEGLPLSKERKVLARQSLLESLAALGKNDARDSVARAYAIKEEEKGVDIARIGTDRITREDLRESLVERTERMLRLEAAPRTPEELRSDATRFVEAELSRPEGRRRAVEEAVSRQLLYREGLRRGFGDDAETQRSVARARKELIGQRVIDETLAKGLSALGPTELKNHYDANKARFVEKAGLEFSYLKAPSEAAAREALAAVNAGTAWSDLPITKGSGPAVDGEAVPGFGRAPEVEAHLLRLGEGEVSSRPIEHEGAFYLFRGEKKRPERQLPFEEAEARVRADLAAIKGKEAIEALQRSLQETFTVEILDPELLAQPAASAQGGAGAAPAPPAASGTGSTGSDGASAAKGSASGPGDAPQADGLLAPGGPVKQP